MIHRHQELLQLQLEFRPHLWLFWVMFPFWTLVQLIHGHTFTKRYASMEAFRANANFRKTILQSLIDFSSPPSSWVVIGSTKSETCVDNHLKERQKGLLTSTITVLWDVLFTYIFHDPSSIPSTTESIISKILVAKELKGIWSRPWLKAWGHVPS